MVQGHRVSNKAGIVSDFASHREALSVAPAPLRSLVMGELSSWWILDGDLDPGATLIAATSH